MFDFLSGASTLLESSYGFGSSLPYTEDDDMMMESYDEIECEDDIEDACYRIAMETTENFYKICEAVTVDEFRHYIITNEEVVYEGSDGKAGEIIDKIKDHIERAWMKVKGFFSKVFSTIEGWVRGDKKFVEANKKAVEGWKGSFKYKGYDFDNNRLKQGACVNILNKFNTHAGINNIEKAMDQIEANIAKGEGNIFPKNFEDELRGAAIGQGAIESSEFSKKLKEYFYGEKSESRVCNSEVAKKALEEIATTKDSKIIARAAFDNNKRAFNGYKKLANNLKKLMKSKDKTGYKESGAGKAIGEWNKMCNKAITISSIVNHHQINALSSRHRQARSLINAVLSQVKTKNVTDVDGKKVASESALNLINFI